MTKPREPAIRPGKLIVFLAAAGILFGVAWAGRQPGLARLAMFAPLLESSR